MSEKYCANCGALIFKDYFVVGDNYLQTKYFDDEESNIFCCKDCVLSALSVLEIDFEDGEAYPV